MNLRAVAKYNAKKAGVPYNLTLDYVYNLWEAQEGKCFYTGTPLTYEGTKADDSISLDRREPAKGYIEGNVVLCCWAFNRIKTNLLLPNLAEICRAFLQRYDAGVL